MLERGLGQDPQTQLRLISTLSPVKGRQATTALASLANCVSKSNAIKHLPVAAVASEPWAIEKSAVVAVVHRFSGPKIDSVPVASDNQSSVIAHSLITILLSHCQSVTAVCPHTCCTSAVVDRNNSMYRCPIDSLCLDSACGASVSLGNSTKASPVALPSGFFTKSTPSTPSRTLQGFSPFEKNSN